LLGRLLVSLGAFPVRRGRNDRPAMRRMLTHMRTEKMMLFPEGTRSRDGRLQSGKRTVGKLLYQARPVVIPTAVLGTDGILGPRRRFWPRRVPVTVCYGTPLDLQRYYALPDSKATAEAIVQEVMGAIASLLYNAHQPTMVASFPAGRGSPRGAGDGASRV
jgi:1-acyl-sn-glycerol-3-phosphate acyltransferase